MITTLPFATLTFATPAGTLLVNGHRGDDRFLFNSLATGFNAALTVAGNQGTNTISLSTPLRLGSAQWNGNVLITDGQDS